ncbi:hypothetical protein TSUD_239180 [Trifolium subterraneum]|uniref:Bromo domain-containing protein n=1 Tax=Trifolium subterraneum TaxID=3900 RepID=A0A2Z6P1K3_TRISU|nr:hypothetical protein TSUD_239180 [Trifolium subterraneum]
MMADSVLDMSHSLFPASASKLSTLSDADISLLTDDAIARLIDAETSCFSKDEKDLLKPLSYSNNDERKLEKQKLLIDSNSHLQNFTTLLPNSQTGSHLLPDYHDTIKDPLDFGTIRKKLDGDGGLHTSSEQFENDVFLVCPNAMKYNSPDTICHRQARARQEIARKDLTEFFPLFTIGKSVISHLFPREAKDKEEEEITHNSPEDTSHPWLDKRLQSSQSDFVVTTIALQGLKGIRNLRKAKTVFRQRRLIPSNRPIFSSKYSRTADVQGLKGIRNLRKAKTVFRQKLEQHQEGTSRAVV